MNVKRLNRIITMLFEDMRNMSDDERDLPIVWNVMHMYSSSQVAKILAMRRGMDIELSAIAAGLHDIAVIMTKKREKHGQRAEAHIRDIIKKYNNGPWNKGLSQITKKEEDLIVKAVEHHSDKDTYTDDPLVELIKDIDSIDRYLHGVKTEGSYLDRSIKVMKELGITIN